MLLEEGSIWTSKVPILGKWQSTSQKYVGETNNQQMSLIQCNLFCTVCIGKLLTRKKMRQIKLKIHMTASTSHLLVQINCLQLQMMWLLCPSVNNLNCFPVLTAPFCISENNMEIKGILVNKGRRSPWGCYKVSSTENRSTDR